jgi:glycerol-3-phosphate dehydrogenase
MRGFRTALLDKGDFGSGSSSRSSQLIHGGLHCLEHVRFGHVLRASRERRNLLRVAPHLVRPCSVIVPLHAGSRFSWTRLALGLSVYDVLSGHWIKRRHSLLGKKSLRAAEPHLRDRDLRGGARYWSARCNDARLTLATVRSAHRHGALAANYVQVTRLNLADGRVRGASALDHVTGRELTIHSFIVVNAAGPWSDSLASMAGRGPALKTTSGVHIAVRRSRLGNRGALTVLSPIDGRLLIIVPSGSQSYIGATDTCDDRVPEDTYATGEDVVYLLRSANALFPHARLTPADVVATWAGRRPLVASESHSTNSGSGPRDHRIVEGPPGLVSSLGGRLATHRLMAAETIDRVAERLHELDRRPVPSRAETDSQPLPGGEVKDLDVVVDGAMRDGFSCDAANRLVRAYGSETPAVTRLALQQPALAQTVAAGHPAILAEILHAIRREMAITLGDLLIRRTRVFREAPDHGASEIGRVADVAAAEMGWDTERRAAELSAYQSEINLTMRFRDELEGVRA